jgi:hypothetical protein
VTSAYGRGALRRADEAIRQLEPGGRNPGTFPHAAGVYELVAGGEVDSEEADRVLLEAGVSVGLPRQEVASILKSARRKGAQKPRRKPDSNRPSVATLPPEPPPKYADADVVRAFVSASQSVLADPQACAYLEQRGIDLTRVSRGRLARFIAEDAELPDEFSPPDARLGDSVPRRCLADADYRLLVELIDCRAQVRSLLVRRCSEDGDGPKSLAFKGSRKHLLMANAAARALLAERGRPALWADAPIEVVIAEGEMDFLSAATEAIPDGTFRAVFGVFSGSWCMQYALAIPDDATVVIATDADTQGDKYAREIAWTLGERSFSRWRPNGAGQDVSDVGGIAGGALECIRKK